jgi:hypothetical protein
LYYLKSKQQLCTDSETVSSQKPLFVTGFFRSGTSITTQLLKELGMHLGPDNHLLLAKNQRAELNPDGFFENYLFMEMSLYAFTKLNSWGHIPPDANSVDNLQFDKTDREKFAEFTLCGVHDDRISNLNKIDALKHYDLLSLNTYLEKQFIFPYAIKNPHFAVLSHFLIKKWPESVFLVCFREPVAAIKSAANITPLLNEAVYKRYYRELIQMPDNKVIFFSHANLMENPEYSLKSLCSRLNLNADKIADAIKLIKPSLHRFRNDEQTTDPELKQLYLELQKRAINA